VVRPSGPVPAGQCPAVSVPDSGLRGDVWVLPVLGVAAAVGAAFLRRRGEARAR
jgi:hypothetical protein